MLYGNRYEPSFVQQNECELYNLQHWPPGFPLTAPPAALEELSMTWPMHHLSTCVHGLDWASKSHGACDITSMAKVYVHFKDFQVTIDHRFVNNNGPKQAV